MDLKGNFDFKGKDQILLGAKKQQEMKSSYPFSATTKYSIEKSMQQNMSAKQLFLPIMLPKLYGT